jgi:1A family penicillin-binding protein
MRYPSQRPSIFRCKQCIRQFILTQALIKLKARSSPTPTSPTTTHTLIQKIYQFRQLVSSFSSQLKPLQLIRSLRPRRRGRPRKWSLDRLWVYQLFHSFFLSYWYTLKEYPVHAFVSLGLGASIFFGTYLTHETVFKDLPAPEELTRLEQIMTSKIYDRQGVLLYSVYEQENRTPIPLGQVPLHLIQATIAIEDKDFYNHHGFSVRGITRAAISNLQGVSVQGGSTLTQQLVKNRLLTPERTFSRKIRELLLAILVEGTYTKTEILEMYFNQIPYGGETYGIEEAAQKYFGKKARRLTLAESALLAGVPAAPTLYSPFGNYPDLAIARQHEVLRRMVEDGYITPEQADAARQEELKFAQNVVNIKAPHFVMYIRDLLVREYGEAMVNKGGLSVTTTLDLALQDEAQAVVRDEISQLHKLRVRNGAALITNPQSGEVLAMIGSTNYFDYSNDGQVNVTLRPRQPGSSIKPLTYALALENGYTPASILEDRPITYHIPGSPSYTPRNYDGSHRGNVTLREALASSYNIPAVKTLAHLGVNQLIDKGEMMGITTWQDRQRFGLSLTLGGGEVLMSDMAELYGVFANNGVRVPLNPILEVKNGEGEVLYRNDCVYNKETCYKAKVLDSGVAFLINSILSDNSARTPTFGPHSNLYIPNQEVAVKTGTTNSLRDNWTIGYTTDRLVAVWVGNNDNTPMSYVASGVTGASPIWNKLMRSLLQEDISHSFPIPDSVVSAGTCITSNSLPCENCPRIVNEYFLAGTQPNSLCNNNQFARRGVENETEGRRDQILEGLMF